jgi:diacylglycerol kinase
MAQRPFSEAFADAADGLAHALRTEPNFRIQILLGLVAVVLAAVLRFSAAQWALLVLVIGLVLCAELFNTCLEHFIDLMHPAEHDLAMRAKHAGAAAVLVASITAIVVGAWLFGSALLRF